MPMLTICSAAISPVYAPQPLKLQFCGVTWIAGAASRSLLRTYGK